MKRNKPSRTCGECIHQWACEAWNVGMLANTCAEFCVNFERASDLYETLKKIFGKEKNEPS